MHKKGQALLIIDVQRDFCSGGSLAVPEGEKIVPVLNRYIQLFLQKKLPIIASRDLHPEKTKHFKKFGGLWPQHCVRGTKGAEFHPDLKLPENTIIITKGEDPEKDSYSVFQGFDPSGKTFKNTLKDLNVTQLFVGGLATDYCVKESVLDALDSGFEVSLLVDAIKGVKGKTSLEAIEKMAEKGAVKMTYEMVKMFLEKSG